MGRADSVPYSGDTAAAGDDHDSINRERVRAGQVHAFELRRKPEVVRRDRLLSQLTAITNDTSLVVVTAPAGYGKTSLLRQWAAEDRRPFSWIQVDAGDRDAIHLIRHIVLALRRISSIDSAVWRALQSIETAEPSVVLPRLLTAAASVAQPWVLVLDDVHELRGGPSIEILVALANGLRPGCHLVISGRGRPGVPLADLRSQGRCLELGPREMRLADDEADVLLGSVGLTAADPIGAELLRRTEGWPASLYLAALAVASDAAGRFPSGSVKRAERANDAVGQFALSAATSGDAFIFDYLRERVLAGESSDTTQFLLRTAPLELLSGPLCDTVLGVSGSASKLAELVDRGVFLTRVVGTDLWYRHHPLFRDMLLTELRQRDPADETRTHRSAAAWCANHGLADRAVDHAIAGGDTRTAARLVASNALEYANLGRIGAVRRWLSALADGAVEEFPPLAIVAGWIWALSGDPARAQECLHVAERGLRLATWRDSLDEPSADVGMAAVAGIARLRAALAPAGVEYMLADARTAVDLESPGGLWYPAAAALLGVAHVLNGDPSAATDILERAAHFGRRRQPASAAFALAQLSLLAADQGDWVAASACADEAAGLTADTALAEHPTSIAVCVAEARVALHRREIERTRAQAGKALRLYADCSPVAFPWLAAQTAIELGRILLDLGNYPGAWLKVTEARRQLARLPTRGILCARHLKLTEDVTAQSVDAHRSSEVALTTAERRVLQLLPTHMTLSEIADALFISRNTVKTQVASIYGKLLASSRAQAVRAARELGLVD